ncbi:MAG: 2-oxoglutarate and iron-dependent oxygenase domain-containing protein [Chloroflexi bacterium]|nr:2-oxoglutarate and iron-dependent oxygenase domain-containing protein [Chloroflexota bacterium]
MVGYSQVGGPRQRCPRFADEACALIEAVRAACTRVGFLQIVGHGIDADLLDGVYRSMEALVGLPIETRRRLSSPTGHAVRGWSARSASGSRSIASTMPTRRAVPGVDVA